MHIGYKRRIGEEAASKDGSFLFFVGLAEMEKQGVIGMEYPFWMALSNRESRRM